ncbi:myosin-14-like [Lingula anatina]|uniref:Myosin-14-like n=1 Tax=Lingula anatina TaxID=7574 RepID=A0A1S3HU37_LINAN|nr:myosin-14-like [Lingula anatina]|eukprot:XP_013389557.1 myosin-14-like [Lingula anatina]
MQRDHFMSEKNKLSLQVQNLTADLEQARDLVAVKNKENLKMHEEHLSLQEKLSEAKSQLRELQDQVLVEADLRKKLDKRNNDLEDDLMKLQLVVGKLDQDGEDTKDSKTDDNIKAEIIRMLQELSLQLHLQQETRGHNSDNAKEMQLLEMYKNKIDGFEMELSSERAMHSLTKTQLRSLEEDNQRLRIQMAQIKKMRNTHTDKSNKTHLEEINDIIARSQTRAKAMFPTGEFNLSMTGIDGENAAMAGTLQGLDYSLKMNEFDRIRSPLNSGVMVETSPGNMYE